VEVALLLGELVAEGYLYLAGAFPDLHDPGAEQVHKPLPGEALSHPIGRFFARSGLSAGVRHFSFSPNFAEFTLFHALW
jgi:hypothetical protein